MDARGLAGCAVALLLFLGGCSGADSENAGADVGAPARIVDSEDQDHVRARGIVGGLDEGGSGAGGSGYVAEETELSSQGTASDSIGRSTNAATEPSLAIGPSIIKTAMVRLSIKGTDFSRAVHEATTVAERYGGYVISTTLDDEGKGFAAATLRIPADKFGAAMGAVRGVGTVESEEITGEDVTQQVIDLEARLRNLRAQEAVLLRLMDDAGTVLETIRIQDHLSGVQLEIERLRGRLRYLDDQVSFSTIFVEMQEAGAGPEPKLGVIGRAWQRALDGALSVVGAAIVAVGFVIPIVLMLALVAIAYRMLRPRLRKIPSVG